MTFHEGELPTFQDLHINTNMILGHDYDVPSYISSTILTGKIYMSNTNQDENDTVNSFAKQVNFETFKCFLSIPRKQLSNGTD